MISLIQFSAKPAENKSGKRLHKAIVVFGSKVVVFDACQTITQNCTNNDLQLSEYNEVLNFCRKIAKEVAEFGFTSLNSPELVN